MSVKRKGRDAFVTSRGAGPKTNLPLARLTCTFRNTAADTYTRFIFLHNVYPIKQSMSYIIVMIIYSGWGHLQLCLLSASLVSPKVPSFLLCYSRQSFCIFLMSMIIQYHYFAYHIDHLYPMWKIPARKSKRHKQEV